MKLGALRDPAAPAEYETRRLVSDLFHQLSQPLTTLGCSLELALLQTPTTEEYGQIVVQALHQAEKASALATAIRELLDAGHAGDNAEILDLRRAVEDTVGDLLPVAESAGVGITCVTQAACPVWFNAQRLRQGLFHLLGFSISASGRGAAVTIHLEKRDRQAVLGLTVSRNAASNRISMTAPDQELLQRLGLGISRAIFEAAGGSFSVQRGGSNLLVKLRIPGKSR